METITINADEETQKIVLTPTSNEQTLTIQATKTSDGISETPSITPSVQEIERFITFLNQKFNIEPSKNLIVLIQKTEPQIKGYYTPNAWKSSRANQPEPSPEDLAFKHQESETEPSNINEITLSSINLLFEPYETIAHEYAHFLNTYLDNYKGNGRNYHTADFKKRAEQMLLKVERGNYGFNQTSETPEFKQMIAEFKPGPNAFKIFQPTSYGVEIVGRDKDGNFIDKNGNIIKPTPKSPTRLKLFVCQCGYKIRASKNGHEPSKPLKAVCGYCNTEFKTQEPTTEPSPAEQPAPAIEPSQTPESNQPEPSQAIGFINLNKILGITPEDLARAEPTAKTFLDIPINKLLGLEDEDDF